MKIITTAILFSAIALGVISCKKDVVGDGPVTTQNRTVNGFSGIDLKMNGDVYYTNSPETKLQVTAKSSIHSMLETTVIDNRLVIKYRNGKTYDADPSIRIDISGPQLNSFVLNTSGSIYLQNDIQAATLFLRSHGSGSIILQHVSANELDAEVTVSGRIASTGGTVASAKLRTDGSGKIDLSAISAKSVNATIIGSGNINTRVTDNLDVTIKGSGSVYFSGNPYISTHISGTGRLVRL